MTDGDPSSSLGSLSLVLCPSPSRKPLSFLLLIIFINPDENYFATSVKIVNTQNRVIEYKN